MASLDAYSNGHLEDFEDRFEEPSQSSKSNSHVNHGWQTVVNTKKQRRQQVKGAKVDERAKMNGDSKSVFQFVDQQAQQHRRKLEEEQEARIAALQSMKSENDKGKMTSDSDSDEGNEKKAVEEKKERPKQPKKPKITVPKAAEKMDQSHLTDFLVEISTSYEGKHDIQMMRLLDYFANAFKPVNSSQFPLRKIFDEPQVTKLAEIPLCYVAEGVNQTTAEWVSRQPVDALKDFSLWALNSVLEDLASQQGNRKAAKQTQLPKKKIAELVVLSIVLRSKPEVLLLLSPVIKTDKQFQGQDKFSLIAWSVAQVCHTDIIIGMSLWAQNLLPLAVSKSSTPLYRDQTLQVIESCILESNKKAKQILLNSPIRKGERLVSASQLILAMYASFPSDSARTKATDRFIALYPLVKDMALAGAHRSKATRPVAQQLLPLCVDAITEENAPLAKEAARVFIWCLAENPECYKQWEKYHMENLKASTLVMTTMAAEWRNLVESLRPLDDLKRTLKSFRLKHKEAMDDGTVDPSIKAAESSCKILLGKFGSGAGTCFKWSFMMLLLAVLIIFLVPSALPLLESGEWKSMLPLTLKESFSKF